LNGFNSFGRIRLALDLEPFFKEKARSNQRAGGQNKGWSKLTEAESLEVRSEVASAAGVCTGNVTKVKQLMTNAHPDIIKALQSEELSIHRAWLWSRLSPEGQREELSQYRNTRGIRKTIRDLISRHRSKTPPTGANVDDLIRLLPALQSGEVGPVTVVLVKVPEKVVFVSEELFSTLRTQQELAVTCATTNP
jgi:hypothetical protein